MYENISTIKKWITFFIVLEIKKAPFAIANEAFVLKAGLEPARALLPTGF